MQTKPHSSLNPSMNAEARPRHSSATIKGHPLHPMLVPLPIGLLAGSLVTDIVFAITGQPFWALMSFWLIAGGLVTGLIAALPGLIDFGGNGRIRELSAAWGHMIGNLAAMAVVGFNLWWRVANGPVDGLWPLGLVLSLLTAAMLGLTGWLGGEMVYRHRVGLMESHMTGPATDPVPPRTVPTPAPMPGNEPAQPAPLPATEPPLEVPPVELPPGTNPPSMPPAHMRH